MLTKLVVLCALFHLQCYFYSGQKLKTPLHVLDSYGGLLTALGPFSPKLDMVIATIVSGFAVLSCLIGLSTFHPKPGQHRIEMIRTYALEIKW